MSSSLTWWLQRMRSLSWDAACDATMVHSTNYCMKVSACQEENSSWCINDRRNGSSFSDIPSVYIRGFWPLEERRMRLAWKQNVCPRVDFVCFDYLSRVTLCFYCFAIADSKKRLSWTCGKFQISMNVSTWCQGYKAAVNVMLNFTSTSYSCPYSHCTRS